MRTALSVIFFFLFSGLSTAQELKGDLKQAPLIRVNQKYTFIKSPAGYGHTQEIKMNPRRSAMFFKEERNSAWFLIDVPFDGIMTFDLRPHQITDDYDWMLFLYNASLEKSIKNEAAKPLRSNNARNSKYTSSKTGLGKSGKSSFVKSGPGNNYSMPLPVKKGMKLALVADNIYGGKGFDIELKIKPVISGPYVVIEGTVKDRFTKDNLVAEVYVEDDSTGVFIAKAITDSTTGRYSFKVPVGRPLNISANCSSYAFKTIDTLIKEHSLVNFLLDTLYSGIKLSLYNIHFYPNKDDILPSSVAELNRLLAFMKAKPEWAIKITGHTNTNVFAPEKYLQQLSFDRALAVKKFLVQNSIPEKRISCAGLGGKDPLIITKDPKAGLKNLRVEVTLLRRL